MYEEKKPIRLQSHVLLRWEEDDKFEVLDILNLKIIKEWGLLSPTGAEPTSPPTWLRNIVCEHLNMVKYFDFKVASYRILAN